MATDPARAALLWVLWHHQGASSPVGQPIRLALGMGPYDRLTDLDVAAAREWGQLARTDPGLHATQRTPWESIWTAIDDWHKAPPGEASAAAADQVNHAIHQQMLAWVEATRITDALTEGAA